MDIEEAITIWELANYSVRKKQKTENKETQPIYTSKSFEDEYEILKDDEVVNTLKESDVIERAEKMSS